MQTNPTPTAGNNPKQMKFPYTFSAKIAQFPYRHYIKNQWIWKYYFIAFVCCIPIFYKISQLSNSPDNVQKWNELKEKRKQEELEHAAK